MTKASPARQLFSNLLVSIIVTLWVAVVGLNWLGYYVDKYGLPGQQVAMAPTEPAPSAAENPAEPQAEDPPEPEQVPSSPPAKTLPAAAAPWIGPRVPETSTPASVNTPVATVTPEPVVEPETDPDPAEAAAASPATPEPDGSPGAVVNREKTSAPGSSEERQFGAFADPDNARRLADELLQGGQEARIEPIETDQGTLYRVRVRVEVKPPESPAETVSPGPEDVGEIPEGPAPEVVPIGD